MKITCVTVGKIKEKYLTEAIREYEKRLSRYCKLEIVELADEKTPEGASPAEEDAIREREGGRILKVIRDDAYVIALAIEGKMLDSVELSQKIEALGTGGVSHIPFPSRPEAGGLCAELFQNDLPPSADAGDSAGADLPELPDHEA